MDVDMEFEAFLKDVELDITKLYKKDEKYFNSLTEEDLDRVVKSIINCENLKPLYFLILGNRLKKKLFSNIEFIYKKLLLDPTFIIDLNLDNFKDEEINSMIDIYCNNVKDIKYLTSIKNSKLTSNFKFVKKTLEINSNMINYINFNYFSEEEINTLKNIFFNGNDTYYENFIISPSSDIFNLIIVNYNIIKRILKNNIELINYIDFSNDIFKEEEKQDFINELYNCSSIPYIKNQTFIKYVSNDFELVKKICLAKASNLTIFDFNVFSIEQQDILAKLIKEKVSDTSANPEGTNCDYNYDYLRFFFITNNSINYQFLIKNYEIVLHLLETQNSFVLNDLDFNNFDEKQKSKILEITINIIKNNKFHLKYNNKNYDLLKKLLLDDYFRVENVNIRLNKIIKEKYDSSLMNIFSLNYDIDIEVFKKIILYQLDFQWRKLIKENPEMYMNLSINICESLKSIGYIKTIEKYKEQIDNIVKILELDKDKLYDIFVKYINSEIQVDVIKDLIDKFNVMVRAKYIEDIFENNINAIFKSYFKIDNEKLNNKINKFYQNLYFVTKLNEDLELQEDIKKDLFAFLKNNNISIDNIKDIRSIILLIFERNFNESLNIIYSDNNIESIYNTYLYMKSYKRLIQSYLPKINSIFSNDQFIDIINYINNESNRINLREKFTITQLKFLNDMLPVIKGANVNIVLNENGIDFKCFWETLNDQQLTMAKDYESKLTLLKKFNRNINEKKKEVCANLDTMDISENEENLVLIKELLNIEEDEYRIIDNNAFMFNEKFLISIIELINIDNFKLIIKNDNINNIFKKFINNIIIHSSILDLYSVSAEVIAGIINSFINIVDELGINNININNLERIIQVSEVYSISNEVERTLLTSEVIRKISKNDSSFNHSNDLNGKKTRINNATMLYYLSQYNNTKTVPFISMKDDLIVENYRNNYEDIYVSGVDTNSCFRLDSTDNNFFIYTLLNKNGFALKFTKNNGEFLGRVSGFRNGNILYLNQLRSVYDLGGNPSRETVYEQQLLVESLLNYIHCLMEKTWDTPEPIEHTLITESYAFNGANEANRFNYVSKTLIDSFPMSTKFDDFNEFKTSPGLREKYLENGFQTDYMKGEYNILLLESKSGCKLTEKSDIKCYDAIPIYKRKRLNVLNDLSNVDEIIRRINRINALRSIADNLEESFSSFKPNFSQIVEIYVGEDWYYIVDSEGNIYEYILQDEIHKNLDAVNEYESFTGNKIISFSS